MPTYVDGKEVKETLLERQLDEMKRQGFQAQWRFKVLVVLSFLILITTVVFGVAQLI